MEMQILVEDRKQIRSNVEQTEGKIITTTEYDDGTILKMTMVNDNISVECNKNLVIQPDGKTVLIRD
ncbi:hypothetical protein [Bacillus sp. Cr_A10]|uniref:hypothetical protein n=1 Tax=Bacillus sp. Cr_A10 TaxID=3033993 RepID=UPI0023D99ABD|nr:hypothetical protein [Bacillus sp. Cr_A10]MDF2065087.1 hypothetical protein [Bacillus sp. Cr_A10]